MPITVTKQAEFDAGHRIAHHGGKCRHPHGHRYRVTLQVAGPVREGDGPDEGMIVDFGMLRDGLAAVTQPLDHAFLVDEADETMRRALNLDRSWRRVIMPGPPTAENIARYLGEQLAKMYADTGLEVVCVVVHETPTCWASWWPS